MGFEDYLLLLVIISSILVAVIQPKEGSRLAKLFKILDLFSVRNPKGIMVMSSKEYRALRQSVRDQFSDSDKNGHGGYGGYSGYGGYGDYYHSTDYRDEAGYIPRPNFDTDNINYKNEEEGN